MSGVDVDPPDATGWWLCIPHPLAATVLVCELADRPYFLRTLRTDQLPYYMHQTFSQVERRVLELHGMRLPSTRRSAGGTRYPMVMTGSLANVESLRFLHSRICAL